MSLEVETFEEITCCVCGTRFAMDAELHELREEDGASFYCPNGHANVYTEGTTQELESDLKETKEALEAEKAHNRSLRCQLLAMSRPKRTIWQMLRLIP